MLPHKHLKIFALIGLAATAFSCQVKNAENVDFVKVKQEIADRKIRKITDQDLIEGGLAAGGKIAARLQELYSLDSMCGRNIASPAEPEMRLIVRKASVECAPSETLGAEFNGLYEAYRYNSQNGIASEANAQKLYDGNILYTLPLEQKDPKAKTAVLAIYLNRKEVIKQYLYTKKK